MYKKRLAFVVLPVFAACAVVGSGFSAWFFDETTGGKKTADATTDIRITEFVEAGTLKVIAPTEGTNYRLVLDQGGFENKDDVTKGISVVSYTPNADAATEKTTEKAVTELKATWTPSVEGTTVTWKDLKDAGLEATVWMEIKLSAAASKYITIADTATWTFDSTTNAWATAKHVLTENDLATDNTYTYTIACQTNADKTNKLFQYTATDASNKAGKPNLKNLYDDMVKTLTASDAGTPVTITYCVSIAAPATPAAPETGA